MRLSETFDRAREVMLRTELHSLPINPFYVCEKLNILVIPYSEMRTDGLFERIGLDPTDNVDGFCYKDDSNHFVIFYDDARTPKERINFTIAHELGHIVLGHLKNVTMRPRYMTNRRNDPREREADRRFCLCSSAGSSPAIYGQSATLPMKRLQSARSRCKFYERSATIRIISRTSNSTVNNFLILSMLSNADDAVMFLLMIPQSFVRSVRASF